VPAEEVERFVLEETDFLATHKTQVLAAMEGESPPGVEVAASKPGRRRGCFPAGSILRFLPQRARTA
jgi:hypothetical protein